MRNMSVTILILCSAFLFSIYGQTLNMELESNECDNFEVGQIYKNPLKGFSVFIFSAGFPVSDTKKVDSINVDIEKCLASFGKVVPSSLLVQAKGGESIDFSGFAPGCFLSYEITDLTDIKGKRLGVLKATLILTVAVEISKTKQSCMPIIWSQSCFLKGSTEKKLERSVSESLKCLLEGFQKEYKQVNEGKPVFNFYQS